MKTLRLRNFSSASDRRKALEKELKVNLKNISSFTLDEAVASSRNCENMIGIAQVPMGVAGPLRISDIRDRTSDVYIPLATTEGALVASVNRGCKAITESGGATVDNYRVGATRGPVFKVNNLIDNNRLNTFLDEHLEDLKKIAQKTSHHLKLKKLITRGVGKYRFIRFAFDTADAMGMNMVTIATQELVQYIEKQTGALCVSVAGNFDIDKKPAWLNVIENRGFKAWAEVTLPSSVLRAVLKTSASKIYEVWLAKCMIGSAMSGSMGFNAQYANVIAATFLATGQDLGHVGEGSMGITTCEVTSSSSRASSASRGISLDDNGIPGQARDDSLYVSVYLPDLMVGTVGGGTGLATQKEALKIIGVDRSHEFAQVVGAAVLAGEISLLASLSEGTLASSHQRLARGKQISKF